MTLWQLALRGLRYHWRTQLGAFLGAVLAAAILTGALAVGDSVRASLKHLALARIGQIEFTLYNPGRFFRTELATTVDPKAAAVALMRGAASSGSGDARAGRVQVAGVTEAFWALGGTTPPALDEDTVILNDRLAQFLGVKVGEDVLLRVDKPSLLSRDAPLSKIEDATVTLRLPVKAIVTEAGFGNFSLEANQVPPYNAFVSRATLQKAIGMEGRANALLIGTGHEAAALTSTLWQNWKLVDAGLKLRSVAQDTATELRTDRVFLEPGVADSAQTALPQTQRVLTYFVNSLTLGQKSTPYSVVSALERPDLKDDEILLHPWLAEDLGAKVGDTLTLKFWLVGPLRKLEEHTGTFRVKAILAPTDPTLDPDLMPDIPGLTDKKDCRQWEPGVPIDLNKIREKDQAYWAAHRGTPKAIITLKAGQTLWINRFGNLTAIRYPKASLTQVEACLRQALNPASLGLFFQPVRERALSASAASTDFGGLFLGFSLFLIVAALLLTGLLFAFGVEQRATEVGTLLALGLTPRQVRSLLLREGGLLALLASVLGAFLATLYTRAVLGGLSGVWKDAVVRSPLTYEAKPETLVGGALSSFLVGLLVIWLVSRKQAQAPVRALLAGSSPGAARPVLSSRGRGPLSSVLLTVLGLGSVAASGQLHGEEAAGLTFMGGALLLSAGLVACRVLLARWDGASGSLTLDGLGVRNAARRPSRSLGAIALFACGSFLVVAINAFRQSPTEAATQRSSGTGGFALYAESALPVYVDLNRTEGREQFALDEQDLQGVTVVPLRLREGDEASCLNLNKIQTPRLVGIDPTHLKERKAFTFTQSLAAKGADPWSLLDWSDGTDAIPVIGDMNTVTWSLQKSLGSTFAYNDDRGVKHTLKIVGVLANSVLQGSLIVSERHFTQLFPNQSGYQVFLIDASGASASTASKALTRGLEDVGLSVTPTTDRLAAFSTVENTYLSIFGLLGGLGLILGSIGLGVIVLRNVLERRGELALLRAVGLPTTALHRLVFAEHALLLVLGLLLGLVSALAAIFPTLRAPGAQPPFGTLIPLLLGVFVSGFVWVWLATRTALRAPLLEALRSE